MHRIIVRSPTTIEAVCLALTGERSGATLLGAINGVRASDLAKQLAVPSYLTLGPKMAAPRWEDVSTADPHHRQECYYWLARIMEAAMAVPESAVGPLNGVACSLGAGGSRCCEGTSDPWPAKPYYYVLPAGKSPEQVCRDFGQRDIRWIELRRVNADDPAGFSQRPDTEWCWWNSWTVDKLLRIPGSWVDERIGADARSRLRDGWGRAVSPEGVMAMAMAVMQAMTTRWADPLAMKLEVAPAVLPGAPYPSDQTIAAAAAARVAPTTPSFR